MNAFPAYFPLAGKRVVIVGEGEGAEAKARLFAGSPAVVDRLPATAGADARAYIGAVLAFVATPDDQAAEAASRAARAAGVPVNVVDRPQLSDFVTPAVIDRGEVVAAVGTGGAAPILASLLRGDIEARVPPGAGRVAALLARLQGEVRAAFPNLAHRRAFLRSVLDGPAADAALAGDAAGAEVLLRKAIAAGLTAAGQVRLIDGRGPADLLTLRAARALAEADVLVVDPGADSGIVSLARRDARRAAAEDMDAAGVAALLAEGLQVVWITRPDGAEALQLRLDAEGVAAQGA